MPQPSPGTGEFLDIAQVAVLLGTSPSALYAQRHRGEAPGALAVKVGRKLTWRRSDLDAWFDSQKVAAHAS